jgi:hypothetical protein
MTEALDRGDRGLVIGLGMVIAGLRIARGSFPAIARDLPTSV